MAVLEYQTIHSAINGDTVALAAVVDHYRGYIRAYVRGRKPMLERAAVSMTEAEICLQLESALYICTILRWLSWRCKHRPPRYLASSLRKQRRRKCLKRQHPDAA